MKPAYLLLSLAALISCTKQKTTINNYIKPVVNTQPAFVINGINDIILTNNFHSTDALTLTVQYLDSAQENVTLSVSGLPAGVVMDNSWVHSGVPTFSCLLSLYDTSGAEPGSYPITLTASTASGKQKTYTFTLTIQSITTYLGKYNNCSSFCGPTVNYTDSVYTDATVQNKIWFSNYANSGHSVYGLLSGQFGGLTIPAQTISGVTYTGTGSISLPHSINLSISGSCALNMFK